MRFIEIPNIGPVFIVTDAESVQLTNGISSEGAPVNVIECVVVDILGNPKSLADAAQMAKDEGYSLKEIKPGVFVLINDRSW